MLTVRCDPRDRSPISVGKVFRTLVPRNNCVRHVEGEAVSFRTVSVQRELW